MESRVRRVHNDIRLKLFDGIGENIAMDLNPQQQIQTIKNNNKADTSLSLPSIHDANKEKAEGQNAPWTDVMQIKNYEYINLIHCQ